MLSGSGRNTSWRGQAGQSKLTNLVSQRGGRLREQIRKNCWQEMGIKHLTMQFSHPDIRTYISVLHSRNGQRNKPTRELTELEWSWIARKSKPSDTNWIYDDSCGLRASLQLACHRVCCECTYLQDTRGYSLHTAHRSVCFSYNQINCDINEKTKSLW